MRRLFLGLFMSILALLPHPLSAQTSQEAVKSGKVQDAGSTIRWKSLGSNLLILTLIAIGGMSIIVIMINRKNGHSDK